MDISFLTGRVLCRCGVDLRDAEVTNETVLRCGMHDRDGVMAAAVRLQVDGVDMRGPSAGFDDDNSNSLFCLADADITLLWRRRGVSFLPAAATVFCLTSNWAWYDFLRSRQLGTGGISTFCLLLIWVWPDLFWLRQFWGLDIWWVVFSWLDIWWVVFCELYNCRVVFCLTVSCAWWDLLRSHALRGRAVAVGSCSVRRRSVADLRYCDVTERRWWGGGGWVLVAITDGLLLTDWRDTGFVAWVSASASWCLTADLRDDSFTLLREASDGFTVSREDAAGSVAAVGRLPLATAFTRGKVVVLTKQHTNWSMKLDLLTDVNVM